MWWLIAAFLAFVILFTLMAYFVGRWLSAYIQRHIGERLDALDQIVNEGRVPETWLRRYRRRAARLKAADASTNQIARLEKVARKQCLANIKELQRYIEGTGVADSPQTRQFLLKELQEQAERWRDDQVWHELVDLTQPEPALHDETGTDTGEDPAEQVTNTEARE